MSSASNSDVSTRDIIFSDRVFEPTEQLIFRGQFAAFFAFAAAAAILSALAMFGA